MIAQMYLILLNLNLLYNTNSQHLTKKSKGDVE